MRGCLRSGIQTVVSERAWRIPLRASGPTAATELPRTFTLDRACRHSKRGRIYSMAETPDAIPVAHARTCTRTSPNTSAGACTRAAVCTAHSSRTSLSPNKCKVDDEALGRTARETSRLRACPLIQWFRAMLQGAQNRPYLMLCGSAERDVALLPTPSHLLGLHD